MFNLFFNIVGFIVFVFILAGAFWISAIFAIGLFGILLTGYIGLKLWSYLVAKNIVNPRPGYPMEPDVIDAEFTRVDVQIEERKK